MERRSVMAFRVTPFLSGTPGERFGVGLSSLLLLPLSCAVAYMAHHFAPARAADDWQRRLTLAALSALLLELSLAFAAFCAVSLVWATLRPAWAQRVLAFAARHVWHAMLLLACGFSALAAVLFVAASWRTTP